MKTKRIIKTIIMLIDNISIGMLWAFAIAALAFAIWRELTR